MRGRLEFDKRGVFRRGGAGLMACILFSALLCRADLPPAAAVLDAALRQIPHQPVRMSGSLRHRAPNGFVLEEYAIVMTLDQSAEPPFADYQLKAVRGGGSHSLRVEWAVDGPVYRYDGPGGAGPDDAFDPEAEIGGTGITWSDLSFSFLRDPRATTTGTGRRLGRDSYVLTVPRSNERELLLWIEQETGRMLGARETDGDGRVWKEIRVVSVKQFDGLWMIKDLDIIHPQTEHRTTLRIDEVEAL